MRKWLTAVFFILSGAISTSPSFADDLRLTVVELFTSQGCSSCPPADAALKSMRDRPGILTLSWPVDYWDRLGWEDTFALPHNAMRQAAYNKRLGRGGVFTPQMIVDGRIQCVGSKPEKVRGSIQKARDIERMALSPSLTRADDSVTLNLPATKLKGTAAVRVVWFLADAEVEIGDGENQGRRLHYTNVVRATDLIDMEWSGNERTISLNVTDGLDVGADHVAILIQEDYGHGPIIGAASLNLGADDTEPSTGH